ncbi:hypothetical protein SAMD00019534_074130 [Acytostelium subglobosum LB1]|uniref:hypothetical protein n=1 Tax=Acytostelium subglobosum LB1 TaxID=1410327 RepID=UPI000644E73B|nr:hypothetical protein SAMD00019534_074130 [Acytostelium subglobosum LB1]GAM24238.1 hypothetical protein SAMD00019534_074130 [Acytostelium subglobosum LB1]|eukprot:XP_012752564.1 hypothetical protein SAMD00019534_074130 [Acytostelium subglobosum LB1]
MYHSKILSTSILVFVVLLVASNNLVKADSTSSDLNTPCAVIPISQIPYCWITGDTRKYDLTLMASAGYPLPSNVTQALNERINSTDPDHCSSIPDDTLGYDMFAKEAMERLRYQSTNITDKCAANIATYICTKTFRSPYPNVLPFCQDVCTALYNNATCGGFTNFTAEVFGLPFTYIPATYEECIKGSVPGNNCTTLSMTAQLIGWKWVGPGEPGIDIYPGGVVHGSILGFGLLASIMLMILGLGLIMRSQQK